MGEKIVIYARATGIYDDSRATKEIKTLLNAGYEVYVIGWNRDGIANIKCNEVFEGKNNVKFIFYNKKIGASIGLKGLHNLLGFLFFVFKNIKAYKKNIYAIHACNLDAGLGAYLASYKYKIPLIYDIYDYYIDSHSIPKCIKGIIEKLEIQIINRAYCTIICTEERKEQIDKAHPKQIEVIYNSPNIERDEQIINLEYDYVYCGTLGDLRLINEILETYSKHQELKVLFAGTGKYASEAEKISKKYENFTYVGAITYEDVIKIEKKAKVISAIYEPSIRNHRLCAPNKFYESLALGKPVIVCRNTGIDNVVKSNNIGMVINYSEKEFYNSLYQLLHNSMENKEMGKRARKIYESTYKWSIMSEKLIKIYEKIYSL